MQHPLLLCEELLIGGIPSKIAGIAICVTALLLLRSCSIFFFRRYVPLHKKLEALEPPKAGRLRLATWNVCNLPREILPEGLELRLKNMVAVILLSKSDIVVMQEIKVDYKKWTGEKLEMSSISFGANTKAPPGRSGSGLARPSKWAMSVF